MEMQLDFIPVEYHVLGLQCKSFSLRAHLAKIKQLHNVNFHNRCEREQEVRSLK